jgi:hypothetical protein
MISRLISSGGSFLCDKNSLHLHSAERRSAPTMLAVTMQQEFRFSFITMRANPTVGAIMRAVPQVLFTGAPAALTVCGRVDLSHAFL